MELWQLRQRQSLSLESKIILTEHRIKGWVNHFHNVHISFSGGKDSTVLLDICKKILGNYIKIVFVDTGLEYPEIREFVKNRKENIDIIKPKKSFYEVIHKYGYPVISKKVARFVRDLQNSSEKNKAVRNLRLTGYNRKGVFCPSMMLSKKWLKLVDSEFKISDQCCDILKKEPLKRYCKRYNSFPMTASMACESDWREKQYLKYGCNNFDGKNPISNPMAFWTEQDILQYLINKKIEYCKIYGKIIKENGGYKLTGEQRTGCMFCMFGIQFEKEPNRFQRMKITHPIQYNYCINKLNCGALLDYLKIPY